MKNRVMALALVTALGALSCTTKQESAGQDAGAQLSAQTASADVVRRGEEVFYHHCSVCHSADTEETIVGLGPSLKGFFSNQSPAPMANGTVLPRTDAAVRELFDKGTLNMPPVKGLSEQQLSDVIAFLHTL